MTRGTSYGRIIKHRFAVFYLRHKFIRKFDFSEDEMEPKNVRITLECTECKQRNYDTTKNKKNDPDRIELKKYCRFCKKRTVHKETK